MKRALFFPHHTGGCNDFVRNSAGGCLRCKAIELDKERALKQAVAKIAGELRKLNPP